MGTEFIPLVFTSGWASGINAYAVVLVMGLADRLFSLSQVPDALGRTDVLVGAGVLFLLEAFADKIPYVDSLWDSVHTVVRPVVGATIGYLVGHEGSSLAAAIGAATGGVTALLSHGVKAGLRTVVNTSPEPASNVVVSTSEDVTVASVMALALAHPWWAATIALRPARARRLDRLPAGRPAPPAAAPLRRLGRTGGPGPADEPTPQTRPSAPPGPAGPPGGTRPPAQTDRQTDP